MKIRRRYRIILGILAVMFAIVMWYAPWWRSQSRVVDYPFRTVQAYLSNAFQTDLGKHGLHPEVLGPSFLQNDTHYFTTTYLHVPGRFLKFDAHFYQIGGELHIFTLRRLAESRTRLTVDTEVHFFLVYPLCTRAEVEILDVIESEMKGFGRPSRTTK